MDLPDRVLAARPGRALRRRQRRLPLDRPRRAAGRSISPDLTRNDPEKLKPSGGPITRDNTGAEVYCTIFALAESPHQQGRASGPAPTTGWSTSRDDGGKTWSNVTPPDLPEWALISIIEPRRTTTGDAYVAATRYKLDDTAPYLYKTTDYGATWTKITNGIPDDEFTRVIREDPNRRGLLYAGTETGIYVSFDDGAQLAAAGRQPPPTCRSCRSTTWSIKDDDLVVATHGRSFWILDDLTPLHQLTDELQGAAVHLFKPRPKVRLRTYRGFRGDPIPRAVNYAHAGTSQLLYDPVEEPDGTTGAALLTAGANPAEGVVVQYYFRDQPAGEVSLAFLDEAGNEIRTYTSDAAADPPRLPAAAGMNRFVWNLRYPGATNVTGEDLQPWHRQDGPLVVPGTYQVRLTVDGQSQTQSFEVLPDPRIAASPEELTAQRDMLLSIRDSLSRTNKAVNALDVVAAQVALWTERTTDPAVSATAGDITSELSAIRAKLIDVNMKQSQLWPSGLHEKFNALFDSVDGADYAPPQQARDVYAELSAQLDELIGKLRDIDKTRMAKLNEMIQAAGLLEVGVDR